jgi:urea transport system permease protein
MFFPDGLAGLWNKYATKYGWMKGLGKVSAAKKPDVSTTGVETPVVLTDALSTATPAVAESTDAAATVKKSTRTKTAISSPKIRGAEA